MKRRLSLANVADIAVIAAALTFIGVTARSYFGSGRPASAAGPARELVGKHLSVNGLDAHATDRTVLLVLAARCPYCSDSADFYRRLSESRKREGFSLVAAFQDRAEGDAFLKEHRIEVDRLITASALSVGVPGTPTLLVFDRSSRVRGVWYGRLNPDGEAKLLETLDKVAHTAAGP